MVTMIIMGHRQGEVTLGHEALGLLTKSGLPTSGGEKRCCNIPERIEAKQGKKVDVPAKCSPLLI